MNTNELVAYDSLEIDRAAPFLIETDKKIPALSPSEIQDINLGCCTLYSALAMVAAEWHNYTVTDSTFLSAQDKTLYYTVLHCTTEGNQFLRLYLL